ncbi:MAG: 2-aminoethylphosphonate/pyruvate transaminase [Bacteroidota bacterium]|nr:2-aminoethylphosphonate/pyruvate transaminase [Bacteroidota bacterium]
MNSATTNTAKDKLLFTPGPLTTSLTVKQAMLNDYGSRDIKFINIVKEIREQLLELAGLKQQEGYEAVLMQGSGTFGVESVISCAIPKDGRLLLLINGAYGERIARMVWIHSIGTSSLIFDEDQWPDEESVEEELKKGGFTHIAMIHGETTSGIINSLEPFGKLAKKYSCVFIVDAMSTFGAVPVDFKKCNIDFLVSSSNKCIEGVPGFSFILAKKDSLKKCENQSRTLSLDLFAQWQGLENGGQFRFTPPTHVLAAFHQALAELKQEGGVNARATRYRKNFEALRTGMRNLGFKEYLPSDKQGYIISTYYYPENPAFDFKVFYEKLNNRDFIIYPGKLTKASCFRIGNIGHLFPEDIDALLTAIAEVKQEMGF